MYIYIYTYIHSNTLLLPSYGKGKDKAVFVHAIRSYGGNGSMVSIILNNGTRWKWSASRPGRISDPGVQ